MRIVLSFFFLFSLPAILAQEVTHPTILVDGTATIATNDNNFICATLDWWPHDKCNYNQCPWHNTSAINLDLSHPLLIKAIQAFKSLRIRIGGSLQDQVLYDVGDLKTPCHPFRKMKDGLFGFSKGCLHMDRWDKLNHLFNSTGAIVTFGLNALYGRHQIKKSAWGGAWDPTNARDFMKYTISKGYHIDSWEFGNELSGSGVGASVNAELYGKDLINLNNIVNIIYKDSSMKPKLVAPGGFFDGVWYSKLLQVSGPGVVNTVTHHIYNLGAGVDPNLVSKILDPHHLSLVSETFSNLKQTIEKNGPWACARASLNHRFEYFLDSMFVKKISTNSNEQSFTVSYLINSCGLSPEFALKASEKLQLETPEKADLVLTLFKNSGFSETQISDLIGRYPLLLLSNPEKNLLPKLEFFLSKGFSSTDLGTVISRYPNILGRSLNNHIIPSFTYLSNLLQSTEKVIRSIKRYPSVLNNDLHILVQPKFNVLRDIGVPERRIVRLFHMWPRVFINYSRHFDEAVDLLKKMGMDPLKSQFDKAIVVMSSMSKSEWDKKVDFYKRLGLSEEDILSAFRKNPWCMVTSKDKITGVMDFFVNKMGWEPSAIAHRPILLSLSLEKRIIPRAAVVQFLSSKGLLKTNFISLTPYNLCDEGFLQKFVNCYDEAPQLKKLYKEKLDLTKMVK